MSGDVHDPDRVELKELPVIGEDLRPRVELLRPFSGLRGVAAAERDDVKAAPPIGSEVTLADPAAPDEADLRRRILWLRRSEVQRGELEVTAALISTDQSISPTVRPREALMTAESTICCPTRAISGERGPSISWPVSMQ